MISEYERAQQYDLVIQELEDFAFFLVDPGGRITSWNPGVERFFGYPEADFVGRDFHEIFTPEDRTAGAPEREMETALREGRSADVRWHVCSNQSRVFVEGVLACVRDKSGQHSGFSKIARAVRPRHAAGSMIATILDGTEDAIYAIDTQGRFVFANTPTAALLGRKVDELIGRTRDEFLPAGLAEDSHATDASVMRGTTSRLVEERFLTHDRGERVMLSTKTPWRGADGEVIGLVAIAKDVTARAAYAGERERLLREVRRSNEDLSAFSHTVAHDLRAPLRSVRTYAELLGRHLRESSDHTSQQFIAVVMQGAESMERLIDSLLRYAESGDELSATSVSVGAVINGLLHTLRPLIEETGATITADHLPVVHADPVRILQLFQNLIVNAMNYRSKQPPRIRIWAEELDTEYRFGVADNGIGIAPEHFDRIFAPLKRVQTNVQGSGIGLALAKKIVETHGGRIWVESVLGKGSTFYFTLPKPAGTGPE